MGGLIRGCRLASAAYTDQELRNDIDAFNRRILQRMVCLNVVYFFVKAAAGFGVYFSYQSLGPVSYWLSDCRNFVPSAPAHALRSRCCMGSC